MSSSEKGPVGGDDTAGSRVVAGRYRLRSVLGSGSMGTVWSAYDEFLHRPVAVKEVRLPPGVPPVQAAELRERTLREARAIAVLSHPNVITLHDVAREDDEPFVVMELLPARSLAGMLREHGPLTVPRAAAVADAVAAALEAAHAAGITHRDVKPGNVLVARDGRIKLTDFGIARNVSEATMTRTGMMLGSPAYIAPEVASGGAVTPAADLWGLGATLFAAVEGRPPYDADGDPLETVGRVVNGAVPRPAPGPLAPLIRGLMAKEPAARLSLQEVRRRLYPLLAQPRHTLFGPELFADRATSRAPDRIDGTATQVIREVPPAPAEPSAGTSTERSAEPEPGELATDPGPLPFAPPAPARRRAGAGAALLAVLLFLVAAAGGFALTRTVGAQPLLPPERPQRTSAPTPPQGELEARTGDATNLSGAKGGLFSVHVPQNWTSFVTQRADPGLPPSTVVQYVSPDGTQTLTVQRFAPFAAPLTVDDYRGALAKQWAPGDFVAVRETSLPDRDGVRLFYRTVERATGPGEASESQLGRSTFAEVFRHGTGLWVVAVTVPTEQERSGQVELFDRIAPTFRLAD
nr:serine/threonine-protein kinase [Amycolatopsis arida]